jgi:phosphopantothenoylcysteine decarboxylase / phosphopantothenate---cysteine ligase
MHRVVLGVCGGIAAYKAVDVCRRLVDAGVHVAPVLTEDAQRFVGAVTFSALASEPAHTSLFSGPDPIPHTTLGQSADVIVVAPATAKLLGKYAAGISDDLLTATLLATRAPVLVCPAMHTEMWEHAAVQENLATLRRRGVHVLEPEAGRLAGGDVGAGRLADPERIGAAVLALLDPPAQSLAGLQVLVTAGGTREAIDPVRYVGNRSSGKMGHAIANEAARRGARVVLVTTSSVPSAPDVEIVRVESAEQMHNAVLARFGNSDVVVMAAAVADFRPKAIAPHKLKKHDGVPEVVLEPTVDILAALGEAKRGDQVVVGFAAETEQLRERAAAKLAAKRVDLMVANDVSAPDAGFEVDTNRAVLLDASGNAEETPLLTKVALAGTVLDRIEEILASRGRGGSL